MPALTALPRNEWREDDVDSDALEQLVLVCLETLARRAQDHGHGYRAARLLDAAGLLRRDAEPINAAGITPRELEVARSVARGCSNRRIAVELVLSERTVDTHVSHILRKLKLTSRAQIAAWVVARQRRFRVLPEAAGAAG